MTPRVGQPSSVDNHNTSDANLASTLANRTPIRAVYHEDGDRNYKRGNSRRPI